MPLRAHRHHRVAAPRSAPRPRRMQHLQAPLRQTAPWLSQRLSSPPPHGRRRRKPRSRILRPRRCGPWAQRRRLRRLQQRLQRGLPLPRRRLQRLQRLHPLQRGRHHGGPPPRRLAQRGLQHLPHGRDRPPHIAPAAFTRKRGRPSSGRSPTRRPTRICASHYHSYESTPAPHPPPALHHPPPTPIHPPPAPIYFYIFLS